MKISSPRHLNRLRRLLELVAEAGGAAVLALKVGTPKSHISALSSGTRGIGDELAAKLERKMGKPAGWMDLPDALSMADLNGIEGQLVTLFRQLPALDQQTLLGTLNARVNPVRDEFGPGSVRFPPVEPTPNGPGMRKTAEQKRRPPLPKLRKER